MLQSCILNTGPQVEGLPVVMVRVCSWVPPPQALEHGPHAVHADSVQPVATHALSALHACVWMKPRPELVTLAHADVVASEGGSEYRTRVLPSQQWRAT